MTKIKIIILVLIATLFSFNQTAEMKLDTNDIEKFNIVEFNEPVVETNETIDEEIPTVEEIIKIKEENSTKKENTSSNNKITSKKTTTSNKTTIEKKQEVKQENKEEEKSNSELTNETKNEEKETKVDTTQKEEVKQEEPKHEEKPKQEEKPKETKVTCDDFYESTHKGRTDVKTKSACISYGEKIVFNELDEVIEYNKVHDNTKDVNIKSFTCYEVLDDNCNTKGWYLHFKCNTSNCDDSRIKKMYG